MDRRILSFALLSLALILPNVAAAQDEFSTTGEPLGTIALSADPTTRVGMLDVESFTPFHFYIIAKADFANIGRPDLNDGNGITAWEASVTVPPTLIIVQANSYPPGFAINIGTNTNWIVGTGVVVPAWESYALLVEYAGLLVTSPAPTDLIVDLGPASPSSFEPTPAPGWVDGIATGECYVLNDEPVKCLRLFANVYGLRINCVSGCAVTIEEPSWGSVKARFGN